MLGVAFWTVSSDKTFQGLPQDIWQKPFKAAIFNPFCDLAQPPLWPVPWPSPKHTLSGTVIRPYLQVLEGLCPLPPEMSPLPEMPLCLLAPSSSVCLANSHSVFNRSTASPRMIWGQLLGSTDLQIPESPCVQLYLASLFAFLCCPLESELHRSKERLFLTVLSPRAYSPPI